MRVAYQCACRWGVLWCALPHVADVHSVPLPLGVDIPVVDEAEKVLPGRGCGGHLGVSQDSGFAVIHLCGRALYGLQLEVRRGILRRVCVSPEVLVDYRGDGSAKDGFAHVRHL